MNSEIILKKTALFEEHLGLKARMVPFAGYSMPVQYSGLMSEHQCVRSHVGIFDVSHMGIAICEGPQAFDFLNSSLTRDLTNTEPGKAAYTLLCLENGGTVDDLIVYRLSQNLFYLVLNASNKEKDFAYLQTLKTQFPDCTLKNCFDSHSLFAVQGPESFKLLKEMGFAQSPPKAFSFCEAVLGGVKVFLAFTGYTGESGYEVFVANSDAIVLWKEFFKKGAAFKIEAIGLGARDTLRTEMGYSLYGHELSEDINPVEAGLSWAIGFKKNNFVGKAALEAAKANPKRKIIALKNSSKQAPRPDMEVYDSRNLRVGKITSGTYAPSLGHAIGLALVDQQSQAPYSVDIRGSKILFDVTDRPFLKR